MDTRNDEETTCSTLLSEQDVTFNRSTVPVPVQDSILPMTISVYMTLEPYIAMLCFVCMLYSLIKRERLRLQALSRNSKMDRDITMDIRNDEKTTSLTLLSKQDRTTVPVPALVLKVIIPIIINFMMSMALVNLFYNFIKFRKRVFQVVLSQNSKMDQDITMDTRNDEETTCSTLLSEQDRSTVPVPAPDSVVPMRLFVFLTCVLMSFFPVLYLYIKFGIKIYRLILLYISTMDQDKTMDKRNAEETSSLTLQSQQVNKRWTHIEGTDIWYDQANRYRKGSKVFDAIRKSGAEDQEAVVKFVIDFKIEDKEINTKLKREIDNHLDTHFHENVVTYFQSGNCEYKKEDAFFILMEKCDRKTLYERIKKENLPYIERAKTVKCIAQGLQHLRGRNILHRDLKPQNILYKGDVPVISDFGLSKKISPDKSHTYQSLKFCGTAGWGAPETYSKNAKNSFAADIYSAGLVFFFALTNGKHPYGDDPGSWHAYIKDDKDCNLKPLYDTPNGEVAYDLISLMLSRDPEHRPTIEEVLKHPFFWDVPTKKYFYYDICSIIEFHNEKKTGSRIFSSQTAKYLKEVGTEIKNWKDKLPLTDAEENNIKDNFWRREREEITVHNDVIQGFAKQLPDSVTSMVCFTRNRFEHSGEDKRKGKIDLTDEELWKFFNSRYPYLFIYTYYASKEYDETKPASDTDKLAKYF